MKQIRSYFSISITSLIVIAKIFGGFFSTCCSIARYYVKNIARAPGGRKNKSPLSLRGQNRIDPFWKLFAKFADKFLVHTFFQTRNVM